MSRPILMFAEVPSFYAAVERSDDPSLRGRPMIVGGDPRKRGQVQSASAEARDAGVEVGMLMLHALERCPRAKPVRTDMARYREVHQELEACLREEVVSLEAAGLGAAFLDASGLDTEPLALARRLRERVDRSLGLSLRVGVASVKFLSRLAAEEADPEEGVREVAAGAEADFLDPLSVARLPGVGPKTVAKLQVLGAKTVAELRSVSPDRLEQALGNHGLRILDLCRGRDASVVRAARHPRSLSQESTFDEGLLDMGTLWERLSQLSQKVEARLSQQGLACRRIGVKVRFEDHETTTRSQTLDRALARAGDIHQVAAALLDRTHAGTRPIRLLGLSVSSLRKEQTDDRQLDLFSKSS